MDPWGTWAGGRMCHWLGSVPASVLGNSGGRGLLRGQQVCAPGSPDDSPRHLGHVLHRERNSGFGSTADCPTSLVPGALRFHLSPVVPSPQAPGTPGTAVPRAPAALPSPNPGSHRPPPAPVCYFRWYSLLPRPECLPPPSGCGHQWEGTASWSPPSLCFQPGRTQPVMWLSGQRVWNGQTPGLDATGPGVINVPSGIII